MTTPPHTVTAEGHLVDSGVMAQIFERIVRAGGSFEVLHFTMGRTNDDHSRVELQVRAPTEVVLEDLLRQLHDLGCVRAVERPLETQPAPRAGIAPEAFYSTTNHPTQVLIDGDWVDVEHQRMDASIVIDAGVARCTKLRDLRAGDSVVCGRGGVKVAPPAPTRGRSNFGFMSGEVSSERKVELLVRQCAAELKELRRAGGRVVVVAGPVVVHTGGAEALASLIRAGFVSALLGGNALAVHDIENQFFGTSLGVSTTTGLPVEEGHHHHIRSINRVNAAGGLAPAVAQGILTRGVMAAAVTAQIDMVLAGSLRDDGPLVDCLTDMNAAQDACAAALAGARLVIILATMLHGIAIGNMLPSTVRTVCVDINPAVATKLADRGTAHAAALVTDVGLFLHLLAQALELPEGDVL